MKNKILRGKYLVKRAVLKDGSEVVILSGIFRPINFSINDIKEDDEMWVSDLEVLSGGIRFTDPHSVDGGSLEDFISGNNQSPKDWKNKEK